MYRNVLISIMLDSILYAPIHTCQLTNPCHDFGERPYTSNHLVSTCYSTFSLNRFLSQCLFFEIAVSAPHSCITHLL